MSASAALAQTALEAVHYAMPLFEMARMRAATSPRRNSAGAFAGPDAASRLRWMNLFGPTRQLLTPRDRRVVTPNNDTLYQNAWLDLSRGPLVLHVPDTADRYYVLGLVDFYTNPFGSIGRRTTGTGEQLFALHGPRWAGELPQGMTAIACPTDAVWVLGRILVDGAGDVPEVNRLQDGFSLKPLEAWRRGEPFHGHCADTWLEPQARASSAVAFFDIVNRALAQNPPPASEAALLERFAPLGIGPKRIREPHELDEAKRAILEQAWNEGIRRLAEAPSGRSGEAWSLPVKVRRSFGTDYFTRALVARNYIGTLGIEDAIYLFAEFDERGEPLSGEHRYALEFAPGGLPPADAFWSITMYRLADRMLADNPIGRYAIGDRTQGLEYDTGGSLRILIRHEPPEAGASNWLPAPREEFCLCLRVYQPRAELLDGSYRVPPVRRLPG
jgi:hypothetical protein